MADYFKKLRDKLFPFNKKNLGPLNNQEEEDDGGTGANSPIDPDKILFDTQRQIEVMAAIRQTEAREFGPVDASTHQDPNLKSSQDPEAQATEGAKAHPILEDKAYFSGVDEIRNNPLYSENTEAEIRYKENQLVNDKKLVKQLNATAQNKNTPSPRPF